MESTWTNEGSKEFFENAITYVTRFYKLHNQVTSNSKVIRQKLKYHTNDLDLLKVMWINHWIQVKLKIN